jgi:hypothetical protein
MAEELLFKVGYYSFYKVINGTKTKYRVDSGKTIFLARFNKHVNNPYRDTKEFPTLVKAREYVKKTLEKRTKEKNKKLSVLPKSLYLVLIKEESSGKTFVKVGFTTKRFIMRRFSKEYGYEGYTLESVLRRINTQDAEKLESEIKDKLKKKKSVKTYRPLLESFSGYSECFDYLSLNDIVKIFDDTTKNYV